MIQFNLLPDIKLKYLKVRRTQHLVITASFLAIAASVFVLVVLIGTVDVIQKKNLSDLNRDIQTYTSDLQNTPNLNKMLTVQDQLESLTTLHNNKPVASRLFGYVEQITPSDASISQLNVDFTQHTIILTGSAKSLDVVQTYADNLKYIQYTQPGGSAAPAFSGVVLSQFTRTTTGASFTITANFDPAIFNSADKITLTVPSAVTARTSSQPTDLFKSGSQ